jgi:simple sugar transport system permease protein
VIGGTVLTGGVGYLAGTVLGVLILGIMQDFITFGNRDAAWTQITTGLLLFVFVAMQTVLGRWKPGQRQKLWTRRTSTQSIGITS